MYETLDDVLAHYGIKGMKWGVHRTDAQIAAARKVALKETPGKKVRASGGKGLPASVDAKRAAKMRQKAKASTTDALSTDDLKELVNRMNLEQQYARLAPKTPSQKAAKFVSEMISGVGKQQANRVANDFAGQKVGEFLKNHNN